MKKYTSSPKDRIDVHINQASQLPDKLKNLDLELSYQKLLPLIKEKGECLAPPSEASMKKIADESYYSATPDFLPEAESLNAKIEQALADTKKEVEETKKRRDLLPPSAHASITFFCIALLLGCFVLLDVTLLGAELINAVSYIEESGSSHFGQKPTILKYISVIALTGVAIALHAFYFTSSARIRKFIIGVSVIATAIVATTCFLSYGIQYAPEPPSADSDETSKQAIVNAMLAGDQEKAVEEAPNICGVVFIISLLLMPVVIAPLLAAAQKLCYCALQAKYPSVEAANLETKIKSLEVINQKLAGSLASIKASIGLYEKLRAGFSEKVVIKLNSIHQQFIS